MRTTKLLCGCLILQLSACSPSLKNNDIDPTPQQEVAALELELTQQKKCIDSFAAMEELEVAQQILIQQQLMDLKTKMAGAETRLNSLVSHPASLSMQTAKEPHQ